MNGEQRVNRSFHSWRVLSAKLPFSCTTPPSAHRTRQTTSHSAFGAQRPRRKKKKHTLAHLPPTYIFLSLPINLYPPEPFGFASSILLPSLPSFIHPLPHKFTSSSILPHPRPLNNTRFYCCSFIPLYLTHESATYAHRHLLHLDILSLPPQQTPFFPLFSCLQLSPHPHLHRYLHFFIIFYRYHHHLYQLPSKYPLLHFFLQNATACIKAKSR